MGLYPGSKSWAKAEAQGLRVLTADQACAEADVIMLLAPDTSQAQIYREVIAPHLTAGKTLMFGHGFNIRYGQIIPPADVDVSMVAPKGPGHRVRETYAAGQGVPALIAVYQDASGKAKQNALAYASGIGAGRAGVLETTFKEETETDLFGEQAVLCGGVERAGEGRVRDAGRGRLPARDRLLRVPPRAQADRGPDVPGRAELHALLRQRHGRGRRLHRAGRRSSPTRPARR